MANILSVRNLPSGVFRCAVVELVLVIIVFTPLVYWFADFLILHRYSSNNLGIDRKDEYREARIGSHIASVIFSNGSFWFTVNKFCQSKGFANLAWLGEFFLWIRRTEWHRGMIEKNDCILRPWRTSVRSHTGSQILRGPVTIGLEPNDFAA